MGEAATAPKSFWLAAMVLGAVSIVLGIIVLAWPSASLAVVAILLAIQVLLFGAFALGRAALAGRTGGMQGNETRADGMRMVAGLFGVFALIVGILVLRDGTRALTTLALLVGIFWFVTGAITALAALMGDGGRDRALAVLTGCLAVVVGIVVLAIPGISLMALAAIAGIWLVVFGALTIGAAYLGRTRGGSKRSRHADAAAA